MLQQDQPFALLELAAALLVQLNDGQQTQVKTWLEDRFRIAARKKYHRLQISCEREICPPRNYETNDDGTHSRPSASNEANYYTSSTPDQSQTQGGNRFAVPSEPIHLQYMKVEALAQKLGNDLKLDVKVQELGVFPSFLNLPDIVSEVYCEQLTQRLQDLQLEAVLFSPPEIQADEALEIAVGTERLKEYITRYKFLPSIEGELFLDSSERIETFVRNWFKSAEEALVTRCEALEGESGIGIGQRGWAEGQADSPHPLSPLISEMVDQLNNAIAMLETSVPNWDELGRFLEQAVSAVHDSIAMVAEQFGVSFPIDSCLTETSSDSEVASNPDGEVPGSPSSEEQNQNAMWDSQVETAAQAQDGFELVVQSESEGSTSEQE